MRGLYNLLFTLVLLIQAPFYFIKLWRRGNWKEGFGERFGKYSSKVKQAITNRHIIWIHAVSVGEVNVCTQLIRAMEPRVPNLKIVVSTTTTTGMGELNRLLPSHIQKIYYPIDRRSYVERAMRTMHPEAVILVEAEIWPNFLWILQDQKIPSFLVNARLSNSSYRSYKRFGFLFRQVFQGFDGVGCQNESDAKKLQELGCRPEAIHVVGNLKFDAAKLEERRILDVPSLLRQLGVPEGSTIFIGGSTHAGEEAILADIFKKLKETFPKLFLVLAPRHFERGKSVGKELESRDIPFYYRSNMRQATQLQENEIQCLLLNTTGELKYFYEHADVIFVGKSLTAQGGQNPIEPGALAKPMLFGPNMQNFETIASALVEKKGACQVKNAEELEKALTEILSNKEHATQLGLNAQAVVRENLGAIERTVDMVLAKFDKVDTYQP
jgi:3-deoxy-D-manno-octulosonic-acid transferase